MDGQMLKGHLTLLVLAIIREKPIHGYAIAREIERRAGALLELGDGTLYPLLYRLESQGHVRGGWKRAATGKDRKVYTITRSGTRRLTEGRRDWESLSRLMREFLGEEGQPA